jgi:hypothetical protein
MWPQKNHVIAKANLFVARVVLLLHCFKPFWIIHTDLYMTLEDQQQDSGHRESVSTEYVQKKRSRLWRRPADMEEGNGSSSGAVQLIQIT